MVLADIVIVTPALRGANNGNWQTAQRWARFLSTDYRVRLCDHWDGNDPATGQARLMIALHARRSAESVAAWHAERPGAPLLVVLTGTDLYRDLADDDAAKRSVALADRLLVLNDHGLEALPPEHRSKAAVCLQSAPFRRTQPKSDACLRALMVGHLRAEKSPQTYFDAARRLAGRSDILLDHIGAALDPALGEQAAALAAAQPNYRWLGGLPHAATRRHIQDAHVLVHASKMEGGAHVVIEALTSGTPVIVSRIAGNLGLLGDGYGPAGGFDWGDDAALATLLVRARDDPAMLVDLRNRCAARAPLFAPDHERATLLAQVAPLVASAASTTGDSR